MQSMMSEKDSRVLLEKLKQDLTALPENENSLALCLESAAKHVPAYLKILKGHIEQLAKVLEMEAHDHRKLENVGLATPVVQLMQLFRELDEQDIQLLETLSLEARHWENEGGEFKLARESISNLEN